jgi:hypothetical protein
MSAMSDRLRCLRLLDNSPPWFDRSYLLDW